MIKLLSEIKVNKEQQTKQKDKQTHGKGAIKRIHISHNHQLALLWCILTN